MPKLHKESTRPIIVQLIKLYFGPSAISTN
jgi:hypothetical protein